MERTTLVGVVMGSKSDYETLSAAVEILRALEIAHETRIVSAHRTPDWLFKYAETARGAASARLLPEPAARRICPACSQRKRSFLYWVYPCRRRN